MSNDPSVLIPISEFTKILRRISDLERKVAKLEQRNPNKEEFENAVLSRSTEAAITAVNDTAFHETIKKLIEAHDFRDAIDNALTNYDFREIIKDLDLTIYAERMLKSDRIINVLTRLVVKRFGIAFECLEDFEAERHLGDENYSEDEELD